MPGMFACRTVFHVMASLPERELCCCMCGTGDVRLTADNGMNGAECLACAAAEQSPDADALFAGWSRLPGESGCCPKPSMKGCCSFLASEGA